MPSSATMNYLRLLSVQTMTQYSDLSTYSYHGGMFHRPETVNVGWLGLEADFRQAPPSDELLATLWEFCKISVAQMRGVHACEFCTADSNHGERNGKTLLLGTSEIRVFENGPRIYAAPTLIHHYVSAHQYAPPEEFVQALRNGPRPGSPEYFDKLTAVGLDWRKTSPVTSKPFRLTPPAK